MLQEAGEALETIGEAWDLGKTYLLECSDQILFGLVFLFLAYMVMEWAWRRSGSET